MIVVEQCSDTTAKLRIVRHLQDHVTVYGIVMSIMPYYNRIEPRELFKIDLNPLSIKTYIHIMPIFTTVVAIGNHFKLTNYREQLVAGYRTIGGQVFRTGWNHKHRALTHSFVTEFFNIRLIANEIVRGATNHTRHFVFQRDHRLR